MVERLRAGAAFELRAGAAIASLSAAAGGGKKKSEKRPKEKKPAVQSTAAAEAAQSTAAAEADPSPSEPEPRQSDGPKPDDLVRSIYIKFNEIKLYEAAEEGDGPAVARLLAAGADPNTSVRPLYIFERSVARVFIDTLCPEPVWNAECLTRSIVARAHAPRQPGARGTFSV